MRNGSWPGGYAEQVIVVIGALAASWNTPTEPAGLAAAVALRVARLGGRVELVSRIGDDPDGDAVLLALAHAGVGHVAVLRDAGRPTPRAAADEPGPESVVVDVEPIGADAAPAASDAAPARPDFAPADLELGLRYLTDFSVVIVTDPLEHGALTVVADAAGFASAHLVAIVSGPADGIPDLPDAATVLEAPADAAGSFAELVAAYAVALDRGLAAREAFDHAIRETGTAVAAADD